MIELFGRTRSAIVLAIVAFSGAAALRAHEATTPTYLADATIDDGLAADRTDGGDNPGGPSCSVSFKLIDAETQASLPGIVRVTNGAGETLALRELLNRGTRLPADHPARLWHVVTEPTTVALPRERIRIDALYGLETELGSVEVDLTGREAAEVVVPLRSFFNPSERGLRNANTHLHLMDLTRKQADRYLQTVPVGDGLELVFVSHLRRLPNEKHYITNEYNGEELQRLNTTRLQFGFGEEHRHNYGRDGQGYGHVMLLDLKELIRPVSIGPGLMGSGTDSPPLRRAIMEARSVGGRVIWCHQGLGLEDVPNWLLGTLDAQNIFDGTDNRNYETSFYPYLNIGIHVPFSTGTDWFVYDFSRAYVELSGPLTPAAWLEALAAGRSFITNGPLLDLTVDGQRPGDVTQSTHRGPIPIAARAVGRQDFVRLELIHNGLVIATAQSEPRDGHFEAEIALDLDASTPGWVALRTDGEAINEFGNQLFSHTSPIYLEFGGQRIFQPDAADALLKDMEAALATVIATSQFANQAEADAVTEVYRDGIAALRAKIQDH